MTSSNDSQSIHELLQIMDVATTLRRERERASQELDIETVRKQLRERLMAAAEATGETVTPEEVDAAIERYYDSLHVYSDPPRGVSTFLAHLYIRRKPIGIGLAALAVLGTLGVWLALKLSSSFSGEARLERRLEAASEEFEQHHKHAAAIAEGPDAIAAVEALEREADAHLASQAADELDAAAERAEALARQLGEEYVLRIVNRPGEQSGVDAYYTDETGTRVSGYYLIVEARSDSGDTLRQSIWDSEMQEQRTVTKWGELVPKAVYERVGADKMDDGIVDDDIFGRKVRGRLEASVSMLGTDGQPLERGRQITRL